MAEFTRHVFICVNDRPSDDERGCCKARGGDAVAAAFKRKLYERGLKRIVRPNRAMCLDQCANGVTLVPIMPEPVVRNIVIELTSAGAAGTAVRLSPNVTCEPSSSTSFQTPSSLAARTVKRYRPGGTFV